jgi:hypothetical protein
LSDRKVKELASVDQPPERKAGDRAFTLAEAAVSAVPVIGGPLAVLLEAIGDPIGRRREHWFREIASAISQLQEHTELLSKPLSENEAFIDAVLHATQMALRTHQAEKLQALRNAVKNSARLGAPNENVQLMFLRFVDELTPLHLRVLSLFEDPRKRLEDCGRALTPAAAGGIAPLIYHYIPESNGQGHLAEQIWRDLSARGLIEHVGLFVAMTTEGVLTPRATYFGRQFLKFIS